MSNSEILAKGVTGVTGSLVAVTIPYAEVIQWGIQGVGGILGTLMVSFLALETFSGAGLAEEMSVNSQFLAQLFGVVLTVVCTLIFTYIALKITSLFTSLRVEEQEEIEGLDLRSHGERAYYND